jgi:hypothetical protein
MDPPDLSSIGLAIERLHGLGALDECDESSHVTELVRIVFDRSKIRRFEMKHVQSCIYMSVCGVYRAV